MTTEIEKPEITIENFISNQLTRFDTEAEVNEQKLLELADSCKELSISDAYDKNGFKSVQSARLKLKSARVSIEKFGKKLRESSNAFNKAVIARENELVKIIEPTEERLQKMEDEYYAEQERIKIEEERKESERIQKRIERLNSVGHGMDFYEIKHLTDEEFEAVYLQAEKDQQERKRQEEEEAIRRKAEEQARLAELEKMRSEQEKKEAELKARQAEIDRQERERLAALKKQQKEIERQERERLAAAKKQQEEIENKLREQERELREREAKIKAHELAIQKQKEEEERKRLEEELIAIEKQELERRALEDAEEQRLLALDAPIIEDYSMKIAAYLPKFPEMQSKRGKSIGERVDSLISEAYELCQKYGKAV